MWIFFGSFLIATLGKECHYSSKILSELNRVEVAS
jgi:hypothetical protein